MTSEALITIQANKREQTGTGFCTKLRKTGMIPAVLSSKGKAVHLTLDPKQLSKVWRAGKTFNLSFEGKTTPVVITELQIDHVKRLPLHIDLAYAK